MIWKHILHFKKTIDFKNLPEKKEPGFITHISYILPFSENSNHEGIDSGENQDRSPWVIKLYKLKVLYCPYSHV